jgi:hypothetical protein
MAYSCSYTIKFVVAQGGQKKYGPELLPVKLREKPGRRPGRAHSPHVVGFHDPGACNGTIANSPPTNWYYCVQEITGPVRGERNGGKIIPAIDGSIKYRAAEHGGNCFYITVHGNPQENSQHRSESE